MAVGLTRGHRGPSFYSSYIADMQDAEIADMLAEHQQTPVRQLLATPSPIHAPVPPIPVNDSTPPMAETVADSAGTPHAETIADSQAPRRRLTSKTTAILPCRDESQVSWAETIADTPKADTAKAKAKAKGKGGPKPKAKGKAKANAKPARSRTVEEEDPSIEPPFKLSHRWKPSHKAMCYMEATVGGEHKQIVTGVSVQSSHFFCDIMERLKTEAENGAFSTKAQAVRRRDELIDEQNRWGGKEADSVAPGEADPTHNSAEWTPDVIDVW